MKKKTFMTMAIVAAMFLTLSAFAITQKDMIVYRGSAANWYCSYSVIGEFPSGSPAPVDTSLVGFGLATATPLVGDVNGDGIADMVVAQDSGAPNIQWVAAHSVNDGSGKGLMSQTTTSGTNFGAVASNVDTLLADINGDGIQDIVDVANGFWWNTQLSSSAGIGGVEQTYVQFGLAGDQPIVGDFDGDGYDDIGVYRQVGGNIFWDSSTDGVIGAGDLGPIGQIGAGATDSLIICNLNNDAFDDAVMVRTGVAGGLLQWFGLINDGTGFLDYFNPGTTIVSFGVDGTDTPMMDDINGDGMDDIVIFRDSAALWVTTFTTAGGALGNNPAGDDQATFGASGDIPLPGEMKLVPEPGIIGLLSLLALAIIRRK